MEGQSYLRILAKYIVQEITPTSDMKSVTTNSNHLGQYAEEAVRSVVRRMSHPLMVATGGIVHPDNYGTRIPQLDTILWSSCPVPPIFSKGSFALIPRHSAFGYLEIKRSAYSDTGERIAEAISHADNLIPEEFSSEYAKEGMPPACGVVCLRLPDQCSNPILSKLEKEGRAFVLIDQLADGSLRPNPDAVWKLVNYVALAKMIGMKYLGTIRVLHLPEAQSGVTE